MSPYRRLSRLALVAACSLLAGCGLRSGQDRAEPEPAPGETATEPEPAESEDTAGETLRTQDCPAQPPSQLPSGSDPGDATEREGTNDAYPALVWGDGDDQVVQLTGSAAIEVAGEAEAFDVDTWPEHEQHVARDGEHRFVMPVGDPGEIQIRFTRAECPYVNVVSVGTTMDDAIEYASRF